MGKRKLRLEEEEKILPEEGRPQCVFKDEEIFSKKSRRVKDMLATKTSLCRVMEMRHIELLRGLENACPCRKSGCQCWGAPDRC